MIRNYTAYNIIVLIITLTVTTIADASGNISRTIAKGEIRMEATVATPAISIGIERKKDLYTSLSTGYERLLTDQLTMGAQVVPGFIYWDEKGKPITGYSFGIVNRYIPSGIAGKGVYYELGIALLYTSREFEGNSSQYNFWSKFGIGYAFPGTQWHLLLGIQHISNGGMARDNDGINSIALSSGYRF